MIFSPPLLKYMKVSKNNTKNNNKNIEEINNPNLIQDSNSPRFIFNINIHDYFYFVNSSNKIINVCFDSKNRFYIEVMKSTLEEYRILLES